MTAVFHGSPIWATPTIPQYVGELMNYSGSYANPTMKRDTAHVFESVFGRPGVCFSLGVWEPPKVGTGQPSHPCPVFLPEREEKKMRGGVVVNKMLQ